jgi:hypothetical protein
MVSLFQDERHVKKVPLEKLMPRLKVLSQPKRITPKYVKPAEKELKSKKIVDWDA